MLLEEQKQKEKASEAETGRSPGWLIEQIGRVVDRLSKVPNTQYQSMFRVVSPPLRTTITPDEERDLKLIAVQSRTVKQKE
jgi:hypothetical protein